MGVEGNKLLHVTRDTELGSWLLDLYQSRFEYGWQESKKVVIPKAVIFDMDGVIIDSMPYHADAWKKAFASVGIKISDQDIYLREGENPKRIVEDIFEEANIEISKEEIKKVIEEKERKFNEIFEIKLFPEVKEFLDELKEDLKALEEFKKFDINAEDCIVVENSPSGIRSAKEAGLDCIALTTSLSRVHLTDADIIVDLLEDVKEYL